MLTKFLYFFRLFSFLKGKKSFQRLNLLKIGSTSQNH